jgi:hypothetical protein
MSDEMIRTSGTLPVAQHLRPKPAFQHLDLDLCPKYTRLRLPSPFAVHWTTNWVDLDEAAGLTIEGEA